MNDPYDTSHHDLVGGGLFLASKERRVGLVFASCCGHPRENEPPPEYDHVRLGLGGIGAICGIGVFAGPDAAGFGF